MYMLTLLRFSEYDSCTFWLESIKSKSTLDAYTIHLSLFCKYHNVNPDQLIQLNNSAGQLKTMILNYIIHLKKIAKQVNQEREKYQLTVSSSILLVLNPSWSSMRYHCLGRKLPSSILMT
jgi:hypothetical protein